MKTKLLHVLLPFCLLLLTGCGPKSTQDMVDQYLEFYYPSTGDFFYQIVFDWGEYLIMTHAKVDEEVHPDSEPYRGYITFRPSTATDDKGQPVMIYLVTPDGDVWMHPNDGSITESTTREEVVEEGSMTTTTTIESPSEPIIQDYSRNPQNWKRYAKLIAKGEKYDLEYAGQE